MPDYAGFQIECMTMHKMNALSMLCKEILCLSMNCGGFAVDNPGLQGADPEGKKQNAGILGKCLGIFMQKSEYPGTFCRSFAVYRQKPTKSRKYA